MEFQIGKAGGSFFRESRRAYDEPPDDGDGPPMMEPQAAKWTRDYITKITFLSYRITAYNKREPVDTVCRGIVLNCSGRLTTFYNLDLVHRDTGWRFIVWRACGGILRGVRGVATIVICQSHSFAL